MEDDEKEEFVNMRERLAVLETLMRNHLKHHETWLKFVLIPIMVGVALTLFKLYWQ